MIYRLICVTQFGHILDSIPFFNSLLKIMVLCYLSEKALKEYNGVSAKSSNIEQFPLGLPCFPGYKGKTIQSIPSVCIATVALRRPCLLCSVTLF